MPPFLSHNFGALCMYLILKGSPVVPPINPSSNVSSEDSGGGGKGVSVTPLGEESGNSKSFDIKKICNFTRMMLREYQFLSQELLLS